MKHGHKTTSKLVEKFPMGFFVDGKMERRDVLLNEFNDFLFEVTTFDTNSEFDFNLKQKMGSY